MNAERRPASATSDDSEPPVDEAGEGKRAAGDGDPEAARSARGPVPDGAESPAGTQSGTDEPAGTEGAAEESDAGSGPDSAAAGAPEEPLAPPETVESLREQLAELRAVLQLEREAALRARAESENVRRRAARDVEQAHRFGIEGLVGELLPVRDGLELGFQAAKDEGSTVESLAEGTEMTLRMLSAALEKFGAVEVDPAGEDFDPRFHQAMTTQEAEGTEPGKVIQVFQKGCLLHGRVVRPAMVIVSR